MKLFLIRHGQSVANLHKYFTGQMDVPLTEAGIAQAAALQPLLAQYPFDKVYTSDLQRAIKTCENALPGVAYTPMKLLREFDVGRAQGVPFAEVVRRKEPTPSERPDYTEFGGENALMVCARAKQFLDMLEASPSEYVAAFSHRGFINCVLRNVLDAVYDSKNLYTDNCAVHVVEYVDGFWRVLALNFGGKV